MHIGVDPIALVLAPLLGLIPAWIAHKKGRSFVLWWIYGTLLFLVALVHSLLIGYSGPSKKCGYCSAMVRQDAKFCPRCGHEFLDAGGREL